MRYQTEVPRRSAVSRPTSRSTLRWWETVGWDTSVRVASSPTVISPSGLVAMADSMRSRSGSARALSVDATAATASTPNAGGATPPATDEVGRPHPVPTYNDFIPIFTLSAD